MELLKENVRQNFTFHEELEESNAFNLSRVDVFKLRFVWILREETVYHIDVVNVNQCPNTNVKWYLVVHLM